ncbi:MAG: ACP phosphodiesterase, partial [Cellvibrionaceae bacterium]|nr:ACP phosphodiesterase [Cellvibrionaceae bacterium]MCV6626851.1 ACP phosphodiesterase [Cellvibrionaceae bacterium]
MNYLAHAFLSGAEPELQLGGLLGDFCKGPLGNWGFSPAVTAGIDHHRKLDAYVDRLPAFKACQALLPKPLKRAGGMVIDISFDHFLAKHWQRYARQSLADFSGQLYPRMQTLTGAPQDFQRFAQRCQSADLFHLYRQWQTVEVAIDRLRQRLSRPQLLDGAFAAVDRNYTQLEQAFHPCFEHLMQWSEQQLEARGYAEGGLFLHHKGSEE